MDDTWGHRDLPVLDAAVQMADASPGIGGRVNELADATQLDVEDVWRAVRALDDAQLIELHGVTPYTHARVPRVSAQARALVGAWPSPESGVDRLIAALERQYEATSDEAERGSLRRAVDGLTGVGRDVLVRVVSDVLTGAISSR